jgi:U3 small nucleolar RNA-associated protein 19
MTSTSAEVAAQIKSLLKKSADDRADAVRLDELRRVFARLIANGEFSLTTSLTANISTKRDKTEVTRKWQHFLSTSHKGFISQLCRRIGDGKRTAVRTLWGVLATSPCKSANNQYDLLSADLLLHWVRAMTRLPVVDQSIRHMVANEFFQPYVDVRYYTIIAVQQTANEIFQRHQRAPIGGIQERADRLVELLMMIPIYSSQMDLSSGNSLFPPPNGAIPQANDTDGDTSSVDDDSDDGSDTLNDEFDDESEEERPSNPKRTKVDARSRDQLFTYERIKNHHRAWSKAWLAVLRLPLHATALKSALRFLPESVLEHVPNPLLFADFFMQAYDNDGVVPLMALDGLFLLMTHHGLEYPNFYKQLYRLVTPSLLHVKYRTRFFRLLDKCLSRNDRLPAHLVAAFCKRLLRRTMTAPPSSILYCLALCSNLLRKHPEISCLVQKQSTANNDSFDDQFDADTDDPERANALRSSLWELHALERHYYPAVVTLAKSVGREMQLVTPLHDTKDFFVTYQSLFEQERKKRQKGKTPLTFVKQESLFRKSDVFFDILKTS